MRSVQSPYGNCSSHVVAQGNIMVARATLLMVLGLSLQAGFVLEQPESSIMVHHYALAWLKSLMGELPWLQWHEAKTYLMQFGGESTKAINLYSSMAAVHKLHRKKPTAKEIQRCPQASSN